MASICHWGSVFARNDGRRVSTGYVQKPKYKDGHDQEYRDRGEQPMYDIPLHHYLPMSLSRAPPTPN